MNIIFHFSQAWRLFRRKIGSGIYLIVVCAVAVVGVAFAIAGFYANMSEISSLSEGITITMFMQTKLDSADATIAREKLRLMPEIQSLRTISPAEAKREFTERFGASIDTLLPENPFPLTFKITIKQEFRTSLGVQSTVDKCKRIPMVADVVYRSGFVNALDTRSRQSEMMAIALGIILLLIFLFTLHSALRSRMALTKQETEVLTLTGAKRSFIAAPYIFYGILLSLVGIGLGVGISIGLWNGLQAFLPWLVSVPKITLIFASGGTFAAAFLLTITDSYFMAKHL